MKKKFLALLCVAVLAFSALPLTAFAAENSGVSLDFATAADAEYFTTQSNNAWWGDGWTVDEENGVFRPSQDGELNKYCSMIEYKTLIAKSETKYISFDFYAAENRFDIVFLDTAAENQWGNEKVVHIHSDYLALTGDIDANKWIAGYSEKYIDGKAHNIKFVIIGGSFSVYVDNVLIEWNNGKNTEELPADSCKLLIRAVNKKSYMDNFIVSDTDIPYKAAQTLVEKYSEISLDFSKATDASQYFTEKVGGWKADGGWFYPNDKYSSTYLTQELKMNSEKYIAFDFYISKNNDGAANTQFNVGIMNDLSADSCTACLHGIMNGDTTLFSLNKSLGSIEKSLLTYNVNWADGYEHNLKIIIDKNTLSFAIDGELLKDGDKVYVMELLDSTEQNDSYLVIQASNTLCYIDNFVISNTDITYTAPEKFGEFVEFTKTFDEPDSDVKKSNGSSGAWQVVDGKLSAGAAWSVGYIDKKIPLNQDKTISMNFKATNEAAHQFIVSLKKNPNHTTENGIACTKGFALHFYNGQVLLTYNAGGPVNEIATATANTNYCDGQEHTLKIIVRNFKAYVLIDDVVLFKGLYLGAGYGYLTLQSTNTTDYIDNLSIKNVAEAISVPSVDGDISTDNVETQAPTADGIESSLKKVGCSGQVNASDIVVSAVAVLLAVCVLVYKKRKA